MTVLKRWIAVGVMVPLTLSAQTVSGVMSPVLTRAYDNSRTGATTTETVLSQASVGTRGIKRLASLTMTGDARGAEAQPLILPGVKMADGKVRDVIVLCSMNNSVWAFDANTYEQLWTVTLGPPANGSASIDMHTINDHWGILSTGVIDPESQTLYVVAWVSPNGTPQRGVHSVFSLKVADGTQVHAPASLAGVSYKTPSGVVETYSGIGGSDGNKTVIMRKQRSSLAFAVEGGRKTVFFASGTVLETSKGAAGWIFAYDVATNTISSGLAMSAGYGAGVWMAGSGLCVDDQGYLYAVTGNGSFDGKNDWSEAVVKVKYDYAAKSLAVVDWWSPYSDNGRIGKDPTQSFAPAALTAKMSGVTAPSEEAKAGKTMETEVARPTNSMAERDLTNARVVGKLTYIKPLNIDTGAYSDEDLGSAGISLIPEYGAVLSAGKDGIAYLVNQKNMGKTMPADFAHAATNYAKLLQPPIWYTYYPGAVDAAPQDSSTLDFLFQGKTRHMHSTSVQYTSPVHGKMLFCWGENSNLRAWGMAPTGKLSYLAESAEVASVNDTASPGGMPGGFMSLSSNNNEAGSAVLWAAIPYGDANSTITNGRLLAYDPDNFVTYPDGTKGLRVLWDSERWGVTFVYNKFNVPVVSGGKLFVPTYSGTVDVYGLP